MAEKDRANREKLDRMIGGGGDPVTGGHQAPAGIGGPQRTVFPKRPSGWSEADNPPRGPRGNLENDNRIVDVPSRSFPPKKDRGPTATTGQPTKPGRGFPRGGMVRDIVEAKMKKIQATPRQQLAAQPIDRNFSA